MDEKKPKKPSKSEPCRIREIPFFQNYFVYLQLKDGARKKNVTYGHYMADLLRDYCLAHNYPVPDAITTSRTYHDICCKVASIEGIPISQVIEKIAVEKIGMAYQQPVAKPVVEEKKKGSVWDLNRDAKR
jgi:hypothetical protein